jgi:hypothetical protein
MQYQYRRRRHYRLPGHILIRRPGVCTAVLMGGGTPRIRCRSPTAAEGQSIAFDSKRI